MDKYNETFATWNKMALQYQEKFMDLDTFNDSYDFFLDSLNARQTKVLDIGCGPGNITRYLLNKNPELDILGIDIASNMIELAKKNNPEAVFLVHDGREIDKLKRKFDGIIAGFCLPYFSSLEAEKLISDALELLTEKGIFYLSFVEGNPADAEFKANAAGDRVFIYYHQTKRILNLLEECSFEVLKIQHIQHMEMDTQRVVIARKI